MIDLQPTTKSKLETQEANGISTIQIGNREAAFVLIEMFSMAGNVKAQEKRKLGGACSGWTLSTAVNVNHWLLAVVHCVFEYDCGDFHTRPTCNIC